MASEFYEQLGVDRTASSTKIRTAYGQHVSRLARRRKALIEQGGDTTQLDLLRARLDEAWEVLSDPLRRRRYDVLLRWTDGGHSKTADALWEEVSDGLVHPAAAVGAKLLRVTSRLSEIGVLPLAPSGSADEPPTLVPHEDDLTSPRAARLGAAGPLEGRPETVRLEPGRLEPGRIEAGRQAPQGALRVVDGSPGASDVLVLPTRELAPSVELPSTPPPAMPPQPSSAPPMGSTAPVLPPGLPADEIGLLVDQLGYGGALLQAVRMRLGLSLQDLSDHTRISVRYLEALESETRDSLPTATFVRGYVREVARLLKLPVDTVVAGYLRRLEPEAPVIEIEVESEQRLDVVVAAGVPEASRAMAARWIRDGHVAVGGRVVDKPGQRVSAGSRVRVEVPPPLPSEAVAQDLPLVVVHEDEDVAVIDKAPGMVVHPGAGHPDGTLVNALLHHLDGLSTIGGTERPGLVHRLDVGTSGLLVVAKNDLAHRSLAAQFAAHTAGRTYLAWVHDPPRADRGRAESVLARDPHHRQRWASTDSGRGKRAVTHWEVLRRKGTVGLICCRLETGRTHQVRVHLSELGAPLLGDATYARRGASALPASLQGLACRTMLHAWRLRFEHPRTGEPMELVAEPPADFRAVADALGVALPPSR